MKIARGGVASRANMIHSISVAREPRPPGRVETAASGALPSERLALEIVSSAWIVTDASPGRGRVGYDYLGKDAA